MDFDPLLGLDRAHLFEHGRRLSESALWDLQVRYYEDNPDIFADGTVPMYATTNAFVARTYAQLIESFAEDCGDARPVTVLELGAGHGQFGFLCLSALLRRGRAGVRYVLSDATGHCVERWAQHPRLAPLIAAGHLDLARFNASEDDTVALAASRETLGADRRCGPLVVIANYVFDSLVQEALQIRGGALELGRVSLISAQASAQASDPGLLAGLEVAFSFSPVEGAVYGDPRLDDILDHYAAHLGDQAFTLPIGAMRCIERLQALSDGPVLILSLDKANNDLEALRSRPTLHVETHGSVSMTVNHDALGRFAVSGGGSALLSTSRAGSLDAAALTLGAPAGPRLTATFADTIEHFSPSDYFELYAGSQPERLPGCLKLLRLSGWDPEWMCELAPTLLSQLPYASIQQRAELRAGLSRSEQLTFSLGAPQTAPSPLVALRAALQ